MKKTTEKPKVKLPTTAEEYETLVDAVVKKFKFKDRNHTAAVISVAIRHLPNDQGFTDLDYLGNNVIKNMANYVANYKGQVLRHEAEVMTLVDLLKQNPNDAQARDGLTKAANEGSELAKLHLEKYNQAIEESAPKNGAGNVIQLT